MRIALIGATGNIGSRILAETLERSHEVTAIVRNPENLAGHPRLKPQKADVSDGDKLARLLQGHEAVAVSLPFSAVGVEDLLDSVKKSGVKRLVIVGGAGSLKTESGSLLVDEPSFPQAWKAVARKGVEWLEDLRREKDIAWTFISPPAMIEAGKRTGEFRTGGDIMLTDADGNSRISTEDYAVAFVDEIENGKYPRKRITVGY